MKTTSVTRLAIIASLGGFLFGFDTAVISGTINLVVNQYNLSTVLEGWYVSSALVGTILGVAVAGWLSDRFGRKEVLLLSGVLFGVSAIGCMVAFGFTDLVIYRLLGGIGVGTASMLSPLYISEIAPAARRGRLVALYQFAITIGILVAYFTNALWLNLATGEGAANFPGLAGKIVVSEPWRIMLGTETIPALVFFLLLFGVPQSPRWLVSRGRQPEAKTILIGLAGESEADREIADIERNLKAEAGGWRLAFASGFKVALVLGILLALLSQFSGINAIIYFGPRIMEQAGLNLGEALGGQVIIGVVNVLFTVLALWKIDTLGRRPLLLFGVTGIIISLVTVGILFYNDTSQSWLLMVFILLFIACFAFSYGPVVWVVLAEIYPTRIRGFAMSIATIFVWIGTAFVGQMTPWLLESIEAHGTFWFFAGCTLPAYYVVIKVMPETRGKTLEEIERYWLEK